MTKKDVIIEGINISALHRNQQILIKKINRLENKVLRLEKMTPGEMLPDLFKDLLGKRSTK